MLAHREEKRTGEDDEEEEGNKEEEMSKRQWTTLQPCDRTGAAKRCKQQQHLYLVLDDWERGYSVRRVDVGAFDSDSGADADLDSAAEPLPEPPLVRLEAQHGYSWSFAAHGTKILAMQPSGYAAFPVFDVATRGLTLCRWPHRFIRREQGKPFFASVAGRLYMASWHYMAALGVPPPPDDTAAAAWSWSQIPSPPPFDGNCILSSAPHPDGRTLFISAQGSTFSLDTDSLEWTCQGKWLMPFRDQAYFDGELDAWVSLCRHKGGIGYICCCDIAAADSRTLPAWKLGKDQLFRADSERHLGATLLHMGNSNYCLIESLARDDEEDLKRLCEDHYYPHNRVLCVTTFVLKYDKQGELRTTGRRVRSYEMTDAHRRSDCTLNPVAFWM